MTLIIFPLSVLATAPRPNAPRALQANISGSSIRLLSGVYCLGGVTFGSRNDYASQPQLLDLWERTPSYAPTPGNFDRERTPSIFCLSPDRVPDERPSPLHQHLLNQLDFLEVDNRGNGGANDGHPPNCIRYLVEWKVTLNSRVLKKDTEQDLVLRPGSYWQQITKDAENSLCRKTKREQRVRPDDTEVVVSVNDRSQRDLTKSFEKTNVDWTTIERQTLGVGKPATCGKTAEAAYFH